MIAVFYGLVLLLDNADDEAVLFLRQNIERLGFYRYRNILAADRIDLCDSLFRSEIRMQDHSLDCVLLLEKVFHGDSRAKTIGKFISALIASYFDQDAFSFI